MSEIDDLRTRVSALEAENHKIKQAILSALMLSIKASTAVVSPDSEVRKLKVDEIEAGWIGIYALLGIEGPKNG